MLFYVVYIEYEILFFFKKQERFVLTNAEEVRYHHNPLCIRDRFVVAKTQMLPWWKRAVSFEIRHEVIVEQGKTE